MAQTKEEKRAYQEAYREKHKDELKEWSRLYREKNRDKILAKQRAYREANREEFVAKARKKRTQRRGFVSDFKMESGCALCGYKVHPAALEFHHVGNNKDRQVSWMLTSTIEKLCKEMNKCVVLCACCHAIEHVSKEDGASVLPGM